MVPLTKDLNGTMIRKYDKGIYEVAKHLLEILNEGNAWEDNDKVLSWRIWLEYLEAFGARAPSVSNGMQSDHVTRL